ncbi:EamA family transporter [Cupriavidus pauculus]|uniref:EamA family transporter n=1 Tax=Cupriavidus pauculus TaxID=82633 RepID=A0A2N5CFF6_9BURK|nr:EamA family transporter [Cupriavidus pauculus]
MVSAALQQRASGASGVGWLLVIVTAVGWGFGWPAMKILIHDWPALFARGSAGMLAALGLAVLAAVRGESLVPPRGLARRLLLTAAINVFAWMGFTALSLRWLHVSEAALLTYTLPIWTTMLAWPVLGERPAPQSVVALCVGMAGMLLLVGGDIASLVHKLPGIAFALSAALLFALGAVTSRRPIAMPPIALSAWLIGLGSLMMIGIGLATEHPDPSRLTPAGAGALVYMALGPMALCYLAWFGALRRVPPGSASAGLLLVPVIGTVSAAFMLGEPLGARVVTALAVTLSGVALELHRSTKAARA